MGNEKVIKLKYLPDGTNWMNMAGDDFADSTGHEIPDNNSAIIAAYSQQSPKSVKLSHDGH